MKTAMQELISTFHLYQNSGCTQEEQELLSFYIKCAENLLEKEKEQIINAYEDGHYIKDEFYNPKEYYNQTYNQKK
jgi:hypothetical protein